MENLKLYKDQLKNIQDLISKLEKGELSISELTALENSTRELHEKSIILKYKAYEKSREKDDTSIPHGNVPASESDIDEKEQAPLDFSIFEEEEISVETDEAILEEEPAEVKASVEEVEKKSSPHKSNGDSFMDRFEVEDNSLNSNLGSAKISSLIGAFGLNEKLRFINELFDGSSEMFSDAIKALDVKESFEEAKNEIDEIASENGWNPEEDTVIDFMAILNRRYA